MKINRKTNILHSLLIAFVLFKISCALRNKRGSFIDVQVRSPKVFSGNLPEGSLDNPAVAINKQLDGVNVQDVVDKTDQLVLSFTGEDLNLKKGDGIWYSGIFLRDGIPFGQSESRIFNRVFKNEPRREKRELANDTEEEEIAIDEDIAKEEEQNDQPISRSGHWPHHDREFGERGPWDGHGEEYDIYGRPFRPVNPWYPNNNNGNGSGGKRPGVKDEEDEPGYEVTEPSVELLEPTTNIHLQTTATTTPATTTTTTSTTTIETFPDIDIRFGVTVV
ncbi:hypothetical protein NQ317_003509 [Molorchus minor]|uniref:Uncharacterized protein n=1 Tax=Molorchus minor TaxID=1323400 RepID=A0ABQ9K2Z2_9CUCU|nr:hypothetical protein NQ317_003509 [Molorchus minor]